MTKQWRTVPSWPEYIVSSGGDVRRPFKKTCLKGSPDKDGYLRVKLHGRTIRVHVIVAEAFHGPRPRGCHAAHLDGNRLNNQADNLAWVTPKENAAHKEEHGTNHGNGGMPGERHPQAKLTAEQVAEIRASGASSRAAAKAFGVSQPQIVRIRKGERWATTKDIAQ